MNLALTQAERAQWQQEGYFIRRSVFSAAEVARLVVAVERAAARATRLVAAGTTYHLDGNRFVDVGHHTIQFEHQTGSVSLRVIEPVHDLDPELGKLMGEARLVEPMRTLVASAEVSVWTAKLNLKPPGEGSGFGWHQDSPYWIHDSDDVDHLPNVFLALDDAGPHNGCLRLVRASHRRGLLPGLADGSQLEGFFTHPDEVIAANVVAPPLSAGSLLFFSPHLIHGSLPNSSSHQRRALIVTYQAAGLAELKSGRPGPSY